MVKKMLAHKVVCVVSLASMGLVVGGLLWAYFSLRSAAAGPLILHFNDLEGITSVGSLGSILFIGVLGIVTVLINFFLAIELEERDRVLGKVVLGITALFAILLFLGIAAIIRVN
jgi:hypothetical protein